MKKCLLLYISLFFCVSPSSWARDYNQDEDEYNQNGDFMPMQDGMMQNNMMMQQPGMMPQNGMMMNQGMMQMPAQMPMQNDMMQNNMMMQQPGWIPQNGMMMNKMEDPGRAEQEDETSKREYVQSLVQNILKVDNRRQNRSFQNGNRETANNRDLKNKLLKLRKALKEFSRSLDGISEADESTVKGSSKKSKSSVASKEAKSSGKSKSASEKAKSSGKSRASKYKTRGKKRSRTYGRKAKFSRFSRPRSFYTVKPLTPQNAVKYVPQFYYSEYSQVANDQQTAPAKTTSYKFKNWGTGEVTPEEAYYHKNSQNSYFSNKSKCNNGCRAQ